jgi:hypothetical protein
MTVSFSLELLNAPAVVTQFDAMPDVLVEVQYRLCGFDGERYGYRTGAATFAAPEPDGFMPYDTLTFEIVKGWTEAAAADDIAVLETEIEAELAQPVQEQKPLPWLVPGIASIGLMPAP